MASSRFDCELKGKTSRRGQFLIESLISISVLMMGFLAIFALLNRSISLNRVASDSYTATYLASEGIEVVRNIIDANIIQKKAWNAGFSNGNYEVEYNSVSLSPDQGRFLAFNPQDETYTYEGSYSTSFKRLIKVFLVSGNEIEVQATVSWTTLGGGNYRIDLENHFMNWSS